MSYAKQNFENGNVLTAEQLNLMDDGILSKQDELVSGENIKTINGESILGGGNIEIYGSGGASESISYLSDFPIRGHYYLKDDGTNASGSWDAYEIEQDGFTKIKNARLGVSTADHTSFYAISFYSASTISTETFISGLYFVDGVLETEFAADYPSRIYNFNNVSIPEGCKKIVICNRNKSLTTPSASIVKTLEVNTLPKVNEDGNYILSLYKKGEKTIYYWERSESSKQIYECEILGSASISANNLFTYETICGMGGQDGAFYGGKIYKDFGTGTVNVIDPANGTITATYNHDKKDLLLTHGNSVSVVEVGGNPYMYTNVYNAYASSDTDKHIGECCVYAISCDENATETVRDTLVQIIKIGFADRADLWTITDGRPYGNFIVDAEHGFLYAYVLDNASNAIKWHKFDLPDVAEGTYDSTYECCVKTLNESDILESWSTTYGAFIQGACYHDNKLWVTHGAGAEYGGDAKLIVIDLETKKEIAIIDLLAAGMTSEPEFVDFMDGSCYYGSLTTMYKIELI